MLITFLNILDPDQDRLSVGPDLDPNCLIPEIIFLKKLLQNAISANFCKQFGPRNVGPDLDPPDTQMVFLKEFLEKVDFEKKSADDKKAKLL